MSESRLEYLLQGYFDNKATPEEIDELMALLATSNEEEEILGVMDRVWETRQAGNPVFSAEKSKSILTGIMKTRTIPVQSNHTRRWNWRYAVAAAILLAGIFGVYNLVSRKERPTTIVKTEPAKNDILPGGNRAVLILADGSQIILDSAANGNLASQGNTKVMKLDGQLAYTDAGKTSEVIYNTITTPRGGQYHLILADGTRVWLNAASSLRYPASFTGTERKVELTGEAYFEVAKTITASGAKQPFKVNVAGKGEVEVLGTHFNINAYSDEASINTTLLEGIVKVSAIDSRLPTRDSRLLSPGQQAQLLSNGQILLNKKPDTDEVIAWKNGKFWFGESADITTIMRQIERWYDVEIEYKGTITGHIGGTISRNVNVSKVLAMLEMTGSVKFQVEGKKVYVMPQKK